MIATGDINEVSRKVALDRLSVPYTGRAVGLPASLRRPGFGFQNPGNVPKMSGEWHQHDITELQAREICAAVRARNQEREGSRDPLNCMGGWEPV